MKDPRFLAAIRALPCLACGRCPTPYAPTEAHHIKTRGAGGDDSWWNIIPLCGSCHTGGAKAWHKGRFTFLRARPHVAVHLRALGWVVDIENEQLYREE